MHFALISLSSMISFSALIGR